LPSASSPSSNFVSAMIRPGAQRVVGGRLVETERDLLDLAEPLLAHQLGRLLARDVLVVPSHAFVAGVKIGSGSLSDSWSPPAAGARRPRRSRGSPSSRSRRDSRARRTRSAASRAGGTPSSGRRRGWRACGSGRSAEEREPVAGEAGQDAALVRDLGRQDDVEGRDAVGRDEQQALVVDLVDLADFPDAMWGLRHVAGSSLRASRRANTVSTWRVYGAEVEGRVEVDARGDLVVGAAELAEVELLLPRAHRRALDEAVGVVAGRGRTRRAR
jgi:hypothetical protein